MIYLPIFGALLEAVGTIIDKKNLKQKEINFKNYTVFGFLFIILVMLPFIYFCWNIKQEAFQLKNILIFASVIICSTLANLLICYSLKREKICEIEPIRLMQPLFTVLLAFIFSFFFQEYYSEKNYLIIALAIIAGFSLIFSHIKKEHLIYNKYLIAALIGSFLFALELVISKSILSYYSSFTFYFIRCFFVFIITFLIFQPKISSIKNKTKLYMIIVSIIWIIYRIVLYQGYLVYGIVFTTILFILAPIFIYLFAKIFLKEKLTLRNMISAAIILACVILAIILENR